RKPLCHKGLEGTERYRLTSSKNLLPEMAFRRSRVRSASAPSKNNPASSISLECIGSQAGLPVHQILGTVQIAVRCDLERSGGLAKVVSQPFKTRRAEFFGFQRRVVVGAPNSSSSLPR